jgi:DNA-3-methyladenine glycosylase II
VRVLQRRPANRVDVWDGGRYARVLATSHGLVQVAVRNRGTRSAPDVGYVVAAGAPTREARAEIARTLRGVLGLDVDPAPFARLAAAQPALRAAARTLRGMRPPRFPDFFEAFANVLPFQQLSLDAGVAIVGRLVDRFGESLVHDGRRHWAFPRAETIAGARDAALRACGLSARKADALKQLARAIASGDLDAARIDALPTAAALGALRELPGIGAWSAALVLLRGFGRLDVFPPGDVGATRGLARLLRIAPGRPLERFIERFGDVRGYLYFCALGASLVEKGLVHGTREAGGG